MDNLINKLPQLVFISSRKHKIINEYSFCLILNSNLLTCFSILLEYEALPALRLHLIPFSIKQQIPLLDDNDVDEDDEKLMVLLVILLIGCEVRVTVPFKDVGPVNLLLGI